MLVFSDKLVLQAPFSGRDFIVWPLREDILYDDMCFMSDSMKISFSTLRVLYFYLWQPLAFTQN